MAITHYFLINVHPPPPEAQNKFIISIHSAIKFYKQLWSDGSIKGGFLPGP